jgi:Flp pilus assembly CpaE family ATPase
MDDVARVVLALETPQVAEEVLHFLDRSGMARVVATAEDGRQMADAIRQTEPDAVVAEPMLAIGGVVGAPLLALAARESVASLRAAIRAGADGFYVWPGEREQLLEGVARSAGGHRGPLPRTASIVSVHAARGGAGCTFVATHLAQALARRGARCVLIDLNIAYADVNAALGAADDARTMADLIPVERELTWEHIDGVLWNGAVLAPPVAQAGSVPSGLVRAMVETAASGADVVVLHLPRVLDDDALWALGQADRAIEVLTLDVMSFRASTRAAEVMAPLDLGDRLAYLVNRAARSEIAPSDVRRVFGLEPVAVIPHDAGAARAQDHGRLLPPKGKVGRAFARLAGELWSVDGAEEAA